MTGMGFRFSDALITLARGSILPLLILTMIASLVLGLPLPPVTCYLILAVLVAPALIKMGIHPMAAHLFVFFFGTLGNISPPVAPTSFAAAGVADTDPMRTTNLAFLFSFPSFLIPYLSVYRTELLLMGSASAILLRILPSFIGISCMAIAFQGHLLQNLKWMERGIFLIAGMLLVYPHWIADVAGYVLIGLLMARQLLGHRIQNA